MRVHGRAGALHVQAFAGTRVVLLALDVDDRARSGLLGFAIQCRDRTAGTEHWLENLRIFEEVRRGPGSPETAPDLAAHAAAVLWGARPPGGLEVGGPYLTIDNPIQAFRWGDYAAVPGHAYTYRVVAMYGRPGALEQGDAVEIDVTTESPDSGVHGVYFNRGVIASQAYTQLFQNRPPSEVPNRAAFRWLSSGLEEALLGFLAQAEDASDGLHAAVYEIDYGPVLSAFAAARSRGASVQIVYDAKAGDRKPGWRNLQAIEDAGLGDVAIPRRANPSYIAHNKFIVLTRRGRPVAVWTGSTNLTSGGIFGQSNVGHVVRDERIASQYLAYWEQLARDPAARELRAWTEASSPSNPEEQLFPIFSPRRSLDVLDGYAQQLGDARSTVFMTAAFGVNARLLAALGERPDVLRYVLLERDGGDVVTIERSADNQAAAGAAIGGALGRWAEELDPRAGQGLNRHVFFIHDKFVLIDALSSSPTLITGSANFSEASTKRNDENMLVIRGDTRVVDVYLGEFLRLFAHYRFRAWVAKLGDDAGGRLHRLGYLDPTDGWTEAAYEDGSREKAERLAFAHPEQARGAPRSARTGAAQRAADAAEEPQDPLVEAEQLTGRALTLFHEGRYAEGIPLARRALELREKALGPAHADVAISLGNLAGLLRAKGDYAEAEELYRRALNVGEKALGKDHPDVALSLNNLAGLLRAKGDYAEAEPLYRRALAILEKLPGKDHPELAATLDNLGLLLYEKGDYAAAEPLYWRALEIWKKVVGEDHPDFAASLNNLGLLLYEKGDFAAAESLYRGALAIVEKALGKEHPDVANILDNLARLLYQTRDYAEAESAYRRALAIREKLLGPDHPFVAESAHNLGSLLQWKGDYAEAESLYRRALAIEEKVFGPDHPDVGRNVDSLAVLLDVEGDHAAAEPLHRRALGILESALGPEHLHLAAALDNFAVSRWASGAPAQAIPLMQRATAIQEQAMSAVIATGSERQKRAFARTLEGATDTVISLHVFALPDRADAARLALTVLLQRKGRVLDAATDTLAQLRRRGRPEDQAKLAELARLRGELATRTLRGPARGEDVSHHRELLVELRAHVEALELQLATRYKALAVQRRAVTLEAVQAALGSDAALVEIALFWPFDPRSKPGSRSSEPRYVAYVLRHAGDPSWVDLGPAAPIDELVGRARELLSAADPLYAEAARALDEKVMQPVRPLLGGAREVYLSPDGELDVMPFAALVDERGQFLLARHRFTYLTSGRDLLHLDGTQREPPRSPPLVLGSPAYDEGGDAEPAVISARRSEAMGNLHFGPLPGTGPEARAVARLLSSARLLLGEDATESAVKALAGPSIVHLATHGFFLERPRTLFRTPDDARAVKPVMEFGAMPSPLPENPLLRSGLALAGANVRRSDGEDGVLTALEVAELDFSGTKLVVLSACETGVGELYRGEGVFGLRRALVLSGAESQVMSLWKVHDEATRALMTAYYERLSADEGRSDAMREVQLAMAREGLHPFYWAAFIVGGSGRSLSGTEPPAVREAELPRAADTVQRRGRFRGRRSQAARR